MTPHDSGAAALPPLRPASARGFSIRPAMVVLGLAVLILAIFVTLGFVTSRANAPVRTSSASSTVAGSTLRAMSASHALSPIVGSGQPPSDILNAVQVPVGSVRVSSQDNSAATGGQYDQQVTLRSDASQAALLAFYASDMRQQGWQVLNKGPAENDPGALQVLGKLAGSDGYYWEMGATVSATSFGGGSPGGGQTVFTIRLLQMNDEED